MKTKLVGKNKKIKEKRKIANRKNVPSSSSIVKFQTECPDVLRCDGCFQTHFPNRKLCMWYLRKHDYEEYKDEIKYENKPKIDISRNGVVRLRGGANRESSFPVLVKRAIQSAKKHGIHLKPGTINKGYGNCAFHSIISNIKTPDQIKGPNFKIQGKLYHSIESILPSDSTSPKFLQLYFYDTDEATKYRHGMMPKLAPKILKYLTSILENSNSYVKSFKCAYECISKDKELRIIRIGDKKKVPEGKHPGIIIINVNDFFLASYLD